MKEYLKIYSLVKEQILGKHYVPGQKLPPERDLSTEYGVSRITARHAIRLLADDGLVERIQGRGTFVKSVKQAKLPIVDKNFTASIANFAPDMRRELVRFEKVVPPIEIAEVLEIEKGEECVLAERVDIQDGQRLAYDKAYIKEQHSSSLDEEILVKVDFADRWNEREGFEHSHSVEKVEAVLSDKHTASMLEIPVGKPLLLTTDIDNAKNYGVVAVFETYYRGDRITLVSTTITK